MEKAFRKRNAFLACLFGSLIAVMRCFIHVVGILPQEGIFGAANTANKVQRTGNSSIARKKFEQPSADSELALADRNSLAGYGHTAWNSVAFSVEVVREFHGKAAVLIIAANSLGIVWRCHFYLGGYAWREQFSLSVELSDKMSIYIDVCPDKYYIVLMFKVKRRNKIKVLVGLSGGVDSAVAALLLKKKGYQVEAAFMKNFSSAVSINSICPWKDDFAEAQRVAKFLDIKLHFWDFEQEYQQTVVKYLFDSYRAGLTPNPDILCNSEIKFKLFLNKALDLGFDKIATGHYAQVKPAGKYFELIKGVDPDKNQVYFLAGLNQDQLSKVIFPLGKLAKKIVRKIAHQNNLPNADRKDSQGICFVGKVKLKDFLRQKIAPIPGDIVDLNGKVLGRHEGVFYFTIGQREGIGVSAKQPLYVIRKEIATNRLVVGSKQEAELYQHEVIVNQWHWIGKKFDFPFKAKAQIRYHQPDQKMTVVGLGAGRFKIMFSEPQFAVASGQILAIYKQKKLIASATIC